MTSSARTSASALSPASVPSTGPARPDASGAGVVTATASKPVLSGGTVDLEAFEQALGDPFDPSAPLSFARSAESDRREQFPADMCRLLDRLGMPSLYVPVEHGGALARYDELTAAVRSVARRDLTLAVGHAKTFLGGVCVWLAGRPEQARALGADIVAGVPVAWGLTEHGHGSDLLAGTMQARRDGDGYRVRGEKWPINNATRGDLICLLVRTRPEGGPRGFSLLLVDKRRLPHDRYRHLPKVPTHGIRGADISGLAMDDCPVPAGALVGTEGGGLETVLKALQLTRTVCTALSLGAADQALRITVEHAARRGLYGRTMVDLPHVRRALGRAHAALFTAEVVSVFAARAVHTMPEELSVISAVAKAYVPSRVDELIMTCEELLGVRGFLADYHEHGAFQKLHRDHRVVGVFDGSTFVNRHSLISQFTLLARGHARITANPAGVEGAADLTAALPTPRMHRLSLTARGGCGLTQGLAGAAADLRGLTADGRAPARLADLADELNGHCERLHEELALCPPSSQFAPPEAFTLARRFELCFAGAAALRVWLHNAAAGHDGLWLEACLVHVLQSLRPARTAADEAVFDRLFDALRTGAPVAPPTTGGGL
ncbi:acyl-CoA dehydrogenase [Actinomadura logoneensis]|uniref:Acyl-CoA dehydrogenase n=1 Tax=Actinomadura logoneensis TaxID=2293572 RepID=A0A372JPJ2_9ACTN|nr:acyl-CoA dehydrogenase family protein [Actinomadura logoneensis]RFU41879.1 acyl-CoA dehydrogenase [Actinomadura logoneensis]